MATKTLTPKQQRFVEEYLCDLNATQAAIRAGYSEKTAEQQGYDNLRKPQIAEAIRIALAKRSAKVEVTAEMVVTGLFTEATLTGDGSSHSARVAAWTQLGKHLGMFGDKLSIGGDKANPIRFALPDLLHEPKYLAYLRDRAVREDSQPSPVREGGKRGPLEDGAAPVAAR